MENKAKRRNSIDEYADVLTTDDIREYLGITKADTDRIVRDPKLKKIDIPIKKVLVKKQDFLNYLG